MLLEGLLGIALGIAFVVGWFMFCVFCISMS